MSGRSSPAKNSPCDYHPYQNHTWIQLHEEVVDKEYQLECARDELQKLSAIEQEGKRKDEVILTLRREIAEYKKCTQSRDMRYASLEEKLSSNDSHLREKTKEVQMLQLELEIVREQLRSSASKSSALRKERSKQSQWEEEVKDLRKKQRSDEESISTLKEEVAEKKRNLQSMQERLKKFRSESQEMKSRLDTAQSIQDSMTNREKELRAEIAQLKNVVANVHQLQAKYNFSEQELLKAKDKENAMAAQLGRVDSELSELCSHVLSSFQAVSGQEATPRVAYQMVTQIAEGYFKTEENLALCEQEMEKYKENLVNWNTDTLHLCKCWKEFQEGVKVNGVRAIDALAEGLQKPTVTEDNDWKELLAVIKESVSALQALKGQSETKQSLLESHIKSCYEKFDAQESHRGLEDAAAMVTTMTSLMQAYSAQISKLKERLVGAEMEHSASLSGAVTALRQDENKRMSDAVDKVRSEEEERLHKELTNLKELHTFEKEEAILQEQEVSSALKKELETLKLVVQSEREERAAEKEKVLDMEAQVVSAEQSKSEAISEAANFKEMLQHQFTEQLSEYKEQAQQYALTIVALEEKLLKLMETHKAVEGENENLAKSLEGALASKSLELQKRDEKVQKMGELVGVLRNQLGLASDGAGQMEVAIKHMEDETLKLKEDMEEQKTQLERSHEEEVSDLRLNMAKQEAIIECLKSDIENLNDSLSKKTIELADKNHEIEQAREEMDALQRSFEASESVIVQQSHRILLEAGHVCLGDKHLETIENQRTAIQQLRERLNELELAKPPVASHQATLKELSRVRHELMKVKSEMPNAKRGAKSQKETGTVKFTLDESSKSQDAALHRVQETLECSERTYGNLVEALCKGMPDLSRCPSEQDDHFKATDEQPKKKQILKERKKFADSVFRKLTLQAKHQARLEASIKSDKSDSAMCGSEEVAEKTPQEVIANLEAVLSATAEELEQQKRLNQSLLKRKNFKESQFSASVQKPRHKCVT